MGYERNPRGTNPQRGYDDRPERQFYGRDAEAGGRYARARDDDPYAPRDAYAQRDESPRYTRQYGAPRQQAEYHGSYGSDGRRFEDVGDRRDWDDDARRAPRNRFGGDAGRTPQNYDHDDRGFVARAGDEVRSWFGDEEAERRREADMRYDERSYGNRSMDDRDSDYHNWRRGQIAALDRDYDEYRQENRSRFENEFSTWRSGRETQRSSLGKVEEHMDVVGSDGSHVGTVDKVRGDRILLTKSDADAGGRHHSIPSRWIQTVDTKVTLAKTADEAKSHWRDEERNQAMFGDDSAGGGRDAQGRMLNRSFSGTY